MAMNSIKSGVLDAINSLMSAQTIVEAYEKQSNTKVFGSPADFLNNIGLKVDGAGQLKVQLVFPDGTTTAPKPATTVVSHSLFPTNAPTLTSTAALNPVPVPIFPFGSYVLHFNNLLLKQK